MGRLGLWRLARLRTSMPRKLIISPTRTLQLHPRKPRNSSMPRARSETSWLAGLSTTRSGARS
eukprot:7915741-Pyramimonas_sp.AAC.1